MSITYIIASYAGKDHDSNKDLSEYVLQIQLAQLKNLFDYKNLHDAHNSIEKIIVICPTPRGEVFENYYQKEKWLDILPIEFIPYIGENKHHSYDQWIQGYLHHPTSDYYLLIEDDYYIYPKYVHIDTELMGYYCRSFPDGIGYLATWAPSDPRIEQVKDHGHHAAISNGMISRQTFEKIPNILDTFYRTTSGRWPQVNFSRLFLDHGIQIKDFSGEYDMHYWDGSEVKNYSYANKAIFLPIQSAVQSRKFYS